MMFPVYDVIEYSLLYIYVCVCFNLYIYIVVYVLSDQFCLTFFSSIAEYFEELVLILVTRKYRALGLV